MKFIITFFTLCFSLPSFAAIDAHKAYFGDKIQVAYVKDSSSRIVSVQMIFKGVGAGIDPIGLEGLGWVALQSIREGGSAGASKQSIEKEFSRIGVLNGINIDINHDDVFLDFECPKKNLKKAFSLIAQMMLKPNLPQNEIDRIKTLLPPGASLAGADESYIAGKILRKKVYGAHPYGRLVATFEGMQPINTKDIQDAIKDRFTQENLLLVIVGDVSKEDISSFLKETLDQLPEKSQSKIFIPQPSPQFDGIISFIPKDSPQSGVAFGQKGLKEKDPHFWELAILNKIIGAHDLGGSRLWEELREKQGLVYSIGTFLSTSELDASLAGTFSCSFDRVLVSIGCVRKIWQEIKENGVTPQEFEDAKTAIIGAYSRRFISSASIADLIASCMNEGFDIDYVINRNEIIKKITLDDVNRVAKEFLNPENLSFVIVGRPEDELLKFIETQNTETVNKK
jgi:zinc protease